MSTVSNDVKAPASGKDRSMLPILSAVSFAFVLAIIVSIYSRNIPQDNPVVNSTLFSPNFSCLNPHHQMGVFLPWLINKV